MTVGARPIILLAGVACFFLVSCSDNQEVDNATSTIAPTTTSSLQSTEPPAPGLLDPVVAYYQALNLEDVDAMLEAWPTGDPDLFAAMTRLTIKVSSTCEPGERPETVDCVEEVGTHDLYGPAGVLGDVKVRFMINEGVITRIDTIDEPAEYARFELAFSEWLAENHPDLSSSFMPGGQPPFASADEATAVVNVLNDFLEDSDRYPLGE